MKMMEAHQEPILPHQKALFITGQIFKCPDDPEDYFKGKCLTWNPLYKVTGKKKQACRQ